MHPEILKKNVALRMYEKFPWINDQKVFFESILGYVHELDKFNERHLNKRLEKYVSPASFDDKIFEKLKDGFLNFALRVNGQNISWISVFQPDNETLVVCFPGVHNKHDDLITYVEVYTTSVKKYFDFMDFISDCYYEENRPSVGFV